MEYLGTVRVKRKMILTNACFSEGLVVILPIAISSIRILKSPLLNNVEIEKARRLLYIIYSSDEHQVTISELKEINLFMDDLAQDIEVLWGLYRIHLMRM